MVGVCNCSMFCCTLLYVQSSFAIILMGKRELVALLSLSSWCCVALPHGAMGLSAVCDCGISCSYSLTIFANVSCSDMMVDAKMLLLATCVHPIHKYLLQ